MNEVLLQIIHRAIRSDRVALRSLIERYQGLTYALAFRQCKKFPLAQRIAQAAWPIVATRLPSLSEPEGFIDLLSSCVEKAAKFVPPMPEDDDGEGGGHSVLKTEKVQARKLLRQALSDCQAPESSVFFLRFVEGLSVEQIAELYGVETGSVIASLRIVCMELVYRAGFAGLDGPVPNPAELPPERREAYGFAVELAEGGLPNDVRQRVERLALTDALVRREDEGVRQILALATRTFAAHRLAPEFVKDVLMAVPYSEPVRVVSLPRPSAYGIAPATSRVPVPAAPVQAAPETGVVISLGLAGLVVGVTGYSWVMSSFLGTWSGMRLGNALAGEEALVGLMVLILGAGLVALFFIRPTLSPRHARFPPIYVAAHGLAAGMFFALLFALLGGLNGFFSQSAIYAVFVPLWGMLVLALVMARARLAFMDLERRIELRLRRLEDHLPSAAFPPLQSHAGTQVTPPPPSPTAYVSSPTTRANVSPTGT
ncbi:MAG: sigma-70 family RNA polymerase sigma factor [Planctomycetota bacterium]|nr:sigma-70 family RNA polymerase sigma factor [Planctomycetota bacterium]